MSTQKHALRSTGYSVAFVLAMAGLAMAVDRGLAAIFVALICLVGLPCLLLSLMDLGKALRSHNGGDFRATRSTWWLSQVQAAFGALCAAVGGFLVYTTASDWSSKSESSFVPLFAIRAFMAVALIFIGVDYIYDAVARRRNRSTND